MTTADITAAAEALGALAQPDSPLGARTTYRVGGNAALLVEVGSVTDLERVRVAVGRSGLPTLVVGKGSNLLVADRGFDGIAIVLGGALSELRIGGLTVVAGGATALPVLARRTAGAGLTGLEWAVGVPGSVGGAVRMNAGGHGSDVAATLADAQLFDLRAAAGDDAVRSVAAVSLELGYRTSAVRPHDVVVGATFVLAEGDRARAEAEIADIVRWRREHQPGGQNAGSVFTNPPEDSAGRLIDAAGLKGHRVGSASVSLKHANFFQADEGGSADDVRALIDEVQRLVEERTGVLLHPELRMVGW